MLILCCAKKADFPVLKGPYLGQKPPGMTPEIFAPGIISTNDHFETSPAFSPDGKEFYFSRTPRLNWDEGAFTLVTTEKKEGWTKPKVAPFSGMHVDFEGHFFPQGKKFIFNRFSTVDTTIQSGLWIIEKTKRGWSEPQFLINGTYATATNRGTIYFAHWDMNGTRALYRMRQEDGEYLEPELLGGDLNTPYYECHPFIHPMEEYIIFDSDRSNPGDQKSIDLYISFRNSDESWGEVLRFGHKLNNMSKNMAYVTQDEKYIFYTSEDSNIYWVDAKIIEELRAKE